MKAQTILCSLFFLSLCSYSQDSILFQIHYLPNHTYHKTSSQKLHYEITYIGDDSLINSLKEKGIENPNIFEKTNNIAVVVSTGALNEQNKMPIQVDFTKFGDSNGIVPNSIQNSVHGMKIFGTVELNKMPVFDSVEGEEIGDQERAIFSKVFQSILSQVSLPDKKMAKGDQFTQTSPITVPTGTGNFKSTISVIYKLTDYSDSLANFDLLVKLSMKVNDETEDGIGEGSGVMIYDRRNEYPLEYKLKYTMELTSDYKDYKVRVEVRSDSETNCTVEKN